MSVHTADGCYKSVLTLRGGEILPPQARWVLALSACGPAPTDTPARTTP